MEIKKKKRKGKSDAWVARITRAYGCVRVCTHVGKSHVLRSVKIRGQSSLVRANNDKLGTRGRSEIERFTRAEELRNLLGFRGQRPCCALTLPRWAHRHAMATGLMNGLAVSGAATPREVRKRARSLAGHWESHRERSSISGRRQARRSNVRWIFSCNSSYKCMGSFMKGDPSDSRRGKMMRFRNEYGPYLLDSSRSDVTDFHGRTIKFKSRANARESYFNPLPRDFFSKLPIYWSINCNIVKH